MGCGAAIRISPLSPFKTADGSPGSPTDEEAAAQKEAAARAAADQAAAERAAAERAAAEKAAADQAAAEKAAAEKAKQLAAMSSLLEPMMNYTMLALGQTGAGKTSLLNLLANLDMTFPDGALPGELIRKFATHTVCNKSLEASPECAMASKTTDASVYTTKLGNVGLTIVDTPGFGDSRGVEADEENVRLIINCLQRVGEINCVLLVINGREARLNATLKYVLSMLTSVMPKTILGNIAVVFTNTESDRKLNFKVDELEKIGLEAPAHVCLDNPLCEAQRVLEASGDLGDEDVSELQVGVQRALMTIARLFQEIKDHRPVSTFHFKEVYEKREEIEALLTNTHERYSEATRKSQEMQRLKDEMMSTGHVEPKVVKTTKWRLVTKDQCKGICHEPGCHQNCYQVVNPAGILSTIRCHLSDKSPCANCGHPLAVHKSSYSHWEGTVVKETLNLGDIERAASERERKEMAVRALEEQIKEEQKEKSKLSAMLFDKLEEYSTLGFPDAYKRLLQGQRSYVQQQLEANPDDSMLVERLARVEAHLKELETSRWSAPVANARQKLAVFEELVRLPPQDWLWKGDSEPEHLQPQRIRAPEMDDKVLSLLLSTTYAKHSKGCSGQDGSSLWLRDVKSVKVWRLEHPVLWLQFANTSTTMKQQLRLHGLVCPALDPPVDHALLDDSVNEVLLWHGTKESILPTIRQWGLDERVCSMNGLHGAGLYFACESCKAGQYAPPGADNVRYLLYTRVLLGLPHYTSSDRIGERRPPVCPEVPGKLYDSVVANAKVANGGKQVHREFVVYDRRQTYPEFEIEISC